MLALSMEGTSLHTNIPQEERMNIVSKTYETFQLNKPPILTLYPRDMPAWANLKRKFLSILTEKIIFKHMVPQWEQHFHGRKEKA